jgi:CHASE3 domain sensor protein
MAARELPKRLWLGLALIVVPFLILISLEAYEVVGRAPRVVQSREQLGHTFDVITVARTLDRAVQDAERGQRGYLLTGDPTYLEPYRTGARDAPMLLERLKHLTKDNPELQRRLPDLELQLTAKLAELQRTVEVGDRDGFEASQQIVRSNRGLLVMREISSLIDATIASETAALSERQQHLADEERGVADAALVSVTVTVVAMSWASSWLCVPSAACNGPSRLWA